MNTSFVPAKLHRAVFFGVLALNFALRCIVALRPIQYIDGRTIPDDAYISLFLARNIARGLGPLYGFDYTNGFQPLYVFLMAPVFRVIPNDLVTPVHVALILLSVFDTLALCVLFRLVSGKSRSAWTPFICAAAWIFSAHFFRTSLNGMETSIACFFTLCGFAHYTKHFAQQSSDSFKQRITLSVILGLAVLARIDSILLVLSIGLLMFFQNLKAGTYQQFLRKALVLGTGILLVNLPWLLFSYHYTGDFYPLSGKAVRFLSLSGADHNPTIQGFYFPMMQKAREILWMNNRILLILTCILFVILAVNRWGSKRTSMEKPWVLPWLWYCVFLFLAYSFYIFTPWFFERYLFPVSILFLFLFGLSVDRVLCLVPEGSARFRVAILLLAAVVGLQATDREFRALFFSRDTSVLGYRNIGMWARKHFPDGTIVGSSQTGALAYFANNLRVINLDGVVNRACFDSLVKHRNMDYIREAEIQYVIGWDRNIDFIKKHSANFHESDLILVTEIEEFRSWGARWKVYKVATGRKR